MADSSKKDANVPRETDAPESSPPGEASGAKVEKTEGSPQGEVSGDQDVHMVGAEEVKDDDMAKESSPPGEESMPEVSSSKDAKDDEVLHDQGILGRQKNVIDPEAFSN